MRHAQNLGNPYSSPPQQKIGYPPEFSAFHRTHGASLLYRSCMIQVSLHLYPNEKQDIESAARPEEKDGWLQDYHNII